MNSSGLIFAMIVGAWAAYLVPMWLRRHDELNDSRPTERFSTAIRLLSGRSLTGRRKRPAEPDADPSDPSGSPAGDPVTTGPPAGETEIRATDLRAYADPVTAVHAVGDDRPGHPGDPADRSVVEDAPAVGAASAATPLPVARARVLARRRRTTMVLLGCFALGGVITAAGGRAWIWLPAVPAVLLIAYLRRIRAQERRRQSVTLDRARAEEAARALRERQAEIIAAAGAVEEPPARREPGREPHREQRTPPALRSAERHRAIVEQTDHAEWLDRQRSRSELCEEVERWDPAPVPLPTYLNAPVAPRDGRHPGADLDAPNPWNAVPSAAEPRPAERDGARDDRGDRDENAPRRRPPVARGPQRTPLFDQFADPDRPRAAGE
ncbi:hypothetical protein [Streptomyces sp. ST2-7A]|uniref:divisome protein SepX/GlpR n=1 Tax=Streptomyces sp. ST2-7A TaxID=2907214 RepID=UPI001F3E83B1|nr:hypothetical protein [Streptomyces sp. ST2-7A]MCE7078966.1 hypothetical protein [Streptomyces sp. ST2-7A]